MSFLDRTALSLAALFTLIPTIAGQDPVPGVDLRERFRERVENAKLELVKRWTWGAEGAPKLPPHPFMSGDPAVGRLAVAANGKSLAIQLGSRIFEVTFADGSFAELPLGNSTLLGPSRDGGLLLQVGTELLEFRVGETELRGLDLDLPRRTKVWVSPTGARVMQCLRTRSGVDSWHVDLADGARTCLQTGRVFPSAFAWHPDGRFVAGAFTTLDDDNEERITRQTYDVRLYDAEGEPERIVNSHGRAVQAMDFTVDGLSLTWVDQAVRRVDAKTGEERATAAHRPLFWANIDPVLAVSHDGDALHLWDGYHLQRVREFPLGEQRPDLPKPTKVPKKGVVLGTAISLRRDLLALATFQGLRLYRIVP